MDDSPARRLRAELIGGPPRCTLAESPRWHDGRWWWVDAQAGKVFSAEPGPGDWIVQTWLSVDRRVPLVHPAGPGWLLVATGRTLHYLSSQVPGRIGPVLAEVDMPAGFALNDGAADADGGVWIGAVSPQRAPGSGWLTHIGTDDSTVRSLESVTLSNGLAYDMSGDVLYHADSLDRVIRSLAVGADAAVENAVEHIRFGPDDGMPDGLATDVAGGLWAAVYGTGQVRRYDARGAVDIVIVVPTPQVTSVGLGGADGRDILITTAREGYDEARSAAEPLAGQLFRARSPYAGRPVFSVRPPMAS